MATGFQLKSGFCFSSRLIKPFSNMGNEVLLYKELDIGLPKPWTWNNFFFGTDYTATTHNVTPADTLGTASSGLAAGSVLFNVESGEPYIYISNPLILKA